MIDTLDAALAAIHAMANTDTDNKFSITSLSGVSE